VPRGTDLTKFGEMRMVAEYVQRTYPQGMVFMRLRLGVMEPDVGPRALSPEEMAMLGVFRRWADAVVVTQDELIVVEASIRSDSGDPSKLVLYGRLVPKTPELTPFLNRRLVLELVVAVEDPAVTALAQEMGIRVRVYPPPWLPEYLAQLHRRERRPVQARGLLTPPATES
jgi:hypothetical protein